MRKILTLTMLILGILTFTSLWATAAPGPNIVGHVWTSCDNPFVGWDGFGTTCVCLSVDYQEGSLFVGTLLTEADGYDTIYGNIEFKPGVLTLNFVGNRSLTGTLSVTVAANGAFGLMKGTIKRDFDWWGDYFIKFLTPTLKNVGAGSCRNNETPTK